MKIYVEGGGDSRDLKIRCREGFRKLIEKTDLAGRMPRFVACGARDAAYNRFMTAVRSNEKFPILLVDSEDPVTEDSPWAHLKSRDNWDKPPGVTDEQAQLMVTCMETWAMADRSALGGEFGSCLQESALLPLSNLEARRRQDVLESLKNATSPCGRQHTYSKGALSFQILENLDPETLKKHLPSFARFIATLEKHL